MRAIVINAQERTVSETEIDDSLKSLQQIVGGMIEPFYQGLEGTGHHAYVNERGLLENPEHFFMLRDGHQPLPGNGVILGVTRDGYEAPCTLPLDWVREQVVFMDLDGVREWAAREGFVSFVHEDAVNVSGKDSRQYSRWGDGETGGADQSPALSLHSGQGQKQ
jgi:hypothetical protein